MFSTYMYMHRDLMSEMALLTYSFVVVKSDVVVTNSPGYYIRFTLAISLVM